jgi:hypothetical protein
MIHPVSRRWKRILPSFQAVLATQRKKLEALAWFIHTASFIMNYGNSKPSPTSRRILRYCGIIYYMTSIAMELKERGEMSS